MRRLALLFLLLFAFALRLWRLDDQGLAYDEAATALMARAAPAAIIDFHWRAAFEHPPFWQLMMHYWSLGAGQSEVALRLPSVLAGVVTLPLLWQLTRRLGLPNRVAMTVELLTATAPVLVYYSQEARMYTLVVALGVASLLLTQGLAVKPTAGKMVGYLLVNWAMLGLHYYSALLIGAEGLFLLIWLLWQRQPLRHWLWHGSALLLTSAPLALWMAFAPGFHDTIAAVLAGVDGPQPTAFQFLADLWLDLSFAAIRWGSPEAVWGYLLLPLLALGAVVVWQPGFHRSGGGQNTIFREGPAYQPDEQFQPSGKMVRSSLSVPAEPRPAKLAALGDKQRGLLLVLVGLLPVVISLVVSRSLATRYLLYIMPPLLVIIAAGIGWLGRRHWLLGLAALAVALTPNVLGLRHYFGPYQKSAYREMAAYLIPHRQPDEAILLEGPRQHLLAKYYLPTAETFLTAPIVALPDYWPVNAPPVVPEEMDDVLRQAFLDRRGVWLSLTAEDEVDPGEFVPKFLTAIAFQRECYAWLDVRLCHFVSPHFVEPQVQSQPDALFNHELRLQTAAVTLRPAQQDKPTYLLITLTWLAQNKPTIDYRVTLRLLDATGGVVSQRDSFPIGPLLPPSTWNAGDLKPGYLALPLPSPGPAGVYQLAANLYDPATLAPVRYERAGESSTDAPLIMAKLIISDTIKLTKP